MKIPKERQIEIEKRILEMYQSIDMYYPDNDLFDITDALGVEISAVDFPSLLSGVENADQIIGALVNSEDEFTILVSSSNSPTRNTFIAAHELGHYILHRDSLTEGKLRLDNQYFENSDDQEEMEANFFASNLLMPKSDFEKWVSQGYGSDELALRYGVSQQAVKVRQDWLSIDKESSV